jgi:hypothetical protein
LAQKLFSPLRKADPEQKTDMKLANMSGGTASMRCPGHITVVTPFHSQNSIFTARKGRSHFLVIQSLVFPLLSAACVFVVYSAIFLAHSPKSTAQKGDFSRDTLKEDRRFLDSLFEKMNCDDGTGRESSLALIQKIDNAGRSESYLKTVPRAMLVVNSEIVRRGALVHTEPAKRKRQNITSLRRHAEVL